MNRVSILLTAGGVVADLAVDVNATITRKLRVIPRVGRRLAWSPAVAVGLLTALFSGMGVAYADQLVITSIPSGWGYPTSNPWVSGGTTCPSTWSHLEYAAVYDQPGISEWFTTLSFYNGYQTQTFPVYWATQYLIDNTGSGQEPPPNYLPYGAFGVSILPD